jgi:glucokinase
MRENTGEVNSKMSALLLAGDVGGTKTLLGLFEARAPRPLPIVVRSFATAKYENLVDLISDFARDDAVAGAAVASACFGIAGPVLGRSATLTNLPFGIDADRVASAFDIGRVSLLNDLVAMAHAVAVLEEAELHVLQSGSPDSRGNMVLIAAGTGLGAAILHRVPEAGVVPVATEGGHADFAARTDREVALMRDLTARYGRAEVEKVLSGQGLVNAHRVTHAVPCTAVEVVGDLSGLDNGPTTEAGRALPAAITAAALARRCQGCMDALDLFVDAYGAEAGNWALRTLATGGVYVGGGIAPKILSVLDSGRFVRSFVDKAPFEALLRQIPVNVILAHDAGLLGAAVYAARL